MEMLTEADGKYFITKEDIDISSNNTDTITIKSDNPVDEQFMTPKSIEYKYPFPDWGYDIPRWIPDGEDKGNGGNSDRISIWVSSEEGGPNGENGSTIVERTTRRYLNIKYNDGNGEKTKDVEDPSSTKLELSSSYLDGLQIKTSDGQIWYLEGCDDKEHSNNQLDGNGIFQTQKALRVASSSGKEKIICSRCKVACNLSCSNNTLNSMLNACSIDSICVETCTNHCSVTCVGSMLFTLSFNMVINICGLILIPGINVCLYLRHAIDLEPDEINLYAGPVPIGACGTGGGGFGGGDCGMVCTDTCGSMVIDPKVGVDIVNPHSTGSLVPEQTSEIAIGKFCAGGCKFNCKIYCSKDCNTSCMLDNNCDYFSNKTLPLDPPDIKEVKTRKHCLWCQTTPMLFPI
jgi:hypothetical protein